LSIPLITLSLDIMVVLIPPVLSDIYTLTRGAKGYLCPLFLDSPHSGARIPPDFITSCDHIDLRYSEDKAIDQLSANAYKQGITTLHAQFHRTYIDLNRALDDLDPDLCADLPDWLLKPSRRNAYGLGLIHTRARGKDIYTHALSKDAIHHRVNHYYKPYYTALDQEIASLHDQFGFVLHLNMHAMPSHSSDGKKLPDIVIGDRDGSTAHRVWRDMIVDRLKQAGFVVTINAPYKGVETIRHTGRPRQGVHALQIEINKALYMNEQTLEFHEGWSDLQQQFSAIWADLAPLLREMTYQRHAAE
jgi:N-formylglutamate deformylase